MPHKIASRMHPKHAVAGLLLAGAVLAARAEKTSPPITINVDSLPASLEPAKINDTTGAWIVALVGERLIESGKPGGLVGALAKSWTISKDGKLYEFTLRSDAKFSDGSPVLADDIIRCFKEVRRHATKGYASFYINAVKDVRKTEAHGVRFTLKNRMNRFLNVLGEPQFSIWKHCGATVCFSGEFKIGASNADGLSLLRRSDGQEFRLVPMPFTEAQRRFGSGELQVLKSYSLMHAPTVRAASSNRLVFNDERAYFIALNTRSPLFSSTSARHSVIERLRLDKVDEVLRKYDLSLAASLASPSFSMGRLDDHAQTASPAPSIAALPNRPIRILSVREHELSPLVSAAFDGISYQHSPLAKKDFIARAVADDYDAIVMGYGTSMRDPVMATMFYSKSAHNWSRVSDSDIDAILENVWSETSPKQRLNLLARLLLKNREHGWYVALAHAPLIFALGPGLAFEDKRPLEDYLLPSPEVDLSRLTWSTK